MDRDPVASETEAAAGVALAGAALDWVRDPGGRVRVEDYLTALAAVTGEAALVAAGVIDIEATDMAPGSRIFGDPINMVLTGDAVDAGQCGPGTVVGALVGALVPGVYALDDFGSLEDRYRFAAENVGVGEWGTVAVSVPDDHAPTVIPLRAAFELRPAMPATGRRHVVAARALAHALDQVKGAIDPAVALGLSLDVAFGMAKMVPMSQAAFEETARSEPEG